MNRFQYLDARLHWFGSCGLIDIRLEEHVRGKKPNKNLFIPLRLEIKRTEKRKSQKLVLLFEDFLWDNHLSLGLACSVPTLLLK